MFRRSLPLLAALIWIVGCGTGSVVPNGTDPVDPPDPTDPPPQPQTEICDGYDNDLDGQVDEGCPCAVGETAECYPGQPGKVGVGICAMGMMACEGSGEFRTWGPCQGAILPRADACENGLDEDCDGADPLCEPEPGSTPDAGVDSGGVDVGVTDPDPQPVCTPGQQQPCYSGPAGTAGKGQCKEGTQTCDDKGQWGACQGEVVPGAEICGNPVDEDCDGQAPECPPLEVPFTSGLGGDCVYASCPPNKPFVVGCEVFFFNPKKPQGCAASTPNNPVVFFKAGTGCESGFLWGHLLCDTQPRPSYLLDASTCPLVGKSDWYYVADRSGCPGE